MPEVNTMTEAVRQVFDSMKPGTFFYGNQLHKRVCILYPPAKSMYTDTIMRMMRRYCKGRYITVNHNKSLFKRI